MYCSYYCSQEEEINFYAWHKLWQDGLLLSGAQNFARELMETPSNLLTPTVFADTLINRFSDLESVEVLARYLIHISLLLNSCISLCIYIFTVVQTIVCVTFNMCIVNNNLHSCPSIMYYICISEFCTCQTGWEYAFTLPKWDSSPQKVNLAFFKVSLE